MPLKKKNNTFLGHAKNIKVARSLWIRFRNSYFLEAFRPVTDCTEIGPVQRFTGTRSEPNGGYVKTDRNTAEPNNCPWNPTAIDTKTKKKIPK